MDENKRTAIARDTFRHCEGCNRKDNVEHENCSGCALRGIGHWASEEYHTEQGNPAPGYAGWAVTYMEAGIQIPAEFRKAFVEIIHQSTSYGRNVCDMAKAAGYCLTCGANLNGRPRCFLCPMAYQHLTATNDRNGKPRRLFVFYGWDGTIVRVIDEGYKGHPHRSLVAGIPQLPGYGISVTEYRALLKENS